MSDDHSARLGLPYLAAGQMQKHVTLNEALTRLDALTQTAVISRGQAAQPGGPDDGDLYILPVGATGAAWTGQSAGTLMRFEAGGWSVVPTPDGLIVVVLDEPAVVMRLDGGWAPLGQTLGEIQGLSRLGLGATADAANPFSVKLNKALWAARGPGEGGDGDLRFTFNKSSASDVLSLLFQSGWSGRAEIGLIGDDDLRLKVSPDGATWVDVLSVDAETGRCAFPLGAARIETTVLTADGGWTSPAWACWVEATVIGAGGGGGAGAQGSAGTVRFGGGGGGAGGISQARLPASALSGGVVAVVGAGGAGGTSAGGAGAGGGDATLSLGGTVILTARGGAGGAGGDAVSGLGGAGGAGDGSGGAGGAASTVASGGAGSTTSAAPGGGGGGGGLDASDTARAGGSGGAGAGLRVSAAGGAGGSGAAGSAGSVSPMPDLSRAGGGGGGGGASISAGHAGGAGGGRGAGGGGGGAGATGFGAGGAGSGGVVILTAIG
ncbi:DUF2793 domain-containing protein [Brevundimonas sp.]|uniref:DUF2793 domain-containing protein n=1 Tax=Brevundimonas sp. TaxID=1871086 RepID=UPI002FD99422